MPVLKVLDSLTDAGHPARTNEDGLGWNAVAAFVLDGATMLGPSVVAAPLTDAAWLSGTIASWLRDRVKPGVTTQDALRDAITHAAKQFEAMASDHVAPWCYPVASLLGVRTAVTGADAPGIELFGLGDAVAFVKDSTGSVSRWTPAVYERDNERASARAALARNGGFDGVGAAYGEEQALQELRRKRMQHNQPGGASWLAGVVPEAADRLRVSALGVGGPVTVLLCTDGFAELVDHYERYDPESLLDAAGRRGLASLLGELRHIEHAEDPAGTRYPRFKQSDDATALLVRIS